jgi:hypothetical protein
MSLRQELRLLLNIGRPRGPRDNRSVVYDARVAFLQEQLRLCLKGDSK